ncbi:MAG TPA: branched-chain amino acid ABC transporter permease [Acidimicrobiia bacterium]|nr:branched-chain amino acid ABC transporter permease [Acidimicrobiia bacterium]
MAPVVLGTAGGGIHQLFDLFLNGVILGAIYVLLALGLNVILGLIGVINFAHAAFYMLGAYLTLSFEPTLGFLPAVLAAAVVVGVIGMLTEVSVIRPLYRRIPEHALLLTFGLTLVAEQAVRWHWGDYAVNLNPPSFLDGGFSPGGFTFPAYRLFVVGATAVAVGLVWLLLNRTNLGLVIRAGVLDAEMVGALGINVPLAFTLTFGLGSLLAGLGGALVGPVNGLNPSMATSIIILAFVVVVIGGLGSFWGSVVGALLVGVLQSVLVYWWNPATELVPFLLMTGLLLVRPRGLFGVEGVFE